MRRGPAAAVLLAALVSACSRGAAPSPEPDHLSNAVAAASCRVPDVSALAESVQVQIHQREDAARQMTAGGNAATDRAAALGALGRVLMAAKLNREAAACFVEAQSIAGDDARWPYYAGHAYLRAGDRTGAAARFEQSLKVRPSELTTLVWLGEAYLDDDRVEQAQDAFQRAVSVQPHSAPALFGAGRASLARRDFSSAARYLEQALAADPKASAIHYPLAMAYRGLGERQKADDQLRQRGTAYPTLVDPLMSSDDELLESAMSFENRGMAALRRGDFAGAIGAFRRGLELDATDTSLRYWLGAALYASGNADAATTAFAEVLRRDPDHARAHYSLGAIYDARGDRPRALAEYQAAVRSDPNLPDARLRVAESLRAAGSIDASVEQYQAAVRLDPTMLDGWIGGAHAFMALKQKERANEWLNEAQRVFPGRPELSALRSELNR
jgi:tetratricopeptide (TPR) repeat protein